jgi:hypothetical protein
MNYYKRSLEDIPKEDTAIWTCTQKGCKGWMRDNFAFDSEPACRLCNSPMVREMKVLPQLLNSNGDLKGIKKGTQID